MADKEKSKGETLMIKCPGCGHIQEHTDTDPEAGTGTYIINCNNPDISHCTGSVELKPKQNGKGWKVKKIKENGNREDYDGIHG